MTTPAPAPAIPTIQTKLPEVKKRRTYIGYFHYRHTHPLQKVFEFEGNLTEAIEKFRSHCDIMNYRFIKVRPFIVDLDDQERRRAEEEFRDDE